MTDDEGAWVGLVKLFKQGSEGSMLLGGACVLGITFCVESTFIADADGVAVVVFDVSTHHRLGATFLDATITSDDVVIADAVGVAPGSMPFVDLGCAAGLVGLDGRAVDD